MTVDCCVIRQKGRYLLVPILRRPWNFQAKLVYLERLAEASFSFKISFLNKDLKYIHTMNAIVLSLITLCHYNESHSAVKSGSGMDLSP